MYIKGVCTSKQPDEFLAKTSRLFDWSCLVQNVQLISDHKYDYADVLPMVFFRGFSRNLFDFLASGGRVVARPAQHGVTAGQQQQQQGEESSSEGKAPGVWSHSELGGAFHCSSAPVCPSKQLHCTLLLL